MNYKKIDAVGRFIIDTLLLSLLITMLMIPVSSFSIIGFDTPSNNEVLSGQDVREVEGIIEYAPETDATEEIIYVAIPVNEEEVEQSTPTTTPAENVQE